jgi:hypothetical protein
MKYVSIQHLTYAKISSKLLNSIKKSLSIALSKMSGHTTVSSRSELDNFHWCIAVYVRAAEKHMEMWVTNQSCESIRTTKFNNAILTLIGPQLHFEIIHSVHFV